MKQSRFLLASFDRACFVGDSDDVREHEYHSPAAMIVSLIAWALMWLYQQSTMDRLMVLLIAQNVAFALQLTLFGS